MAADNELTTSKNEDVNSDDESYEQDNTDSEEDQFDNEDRQINLPKIKENVRLFANFVSHNNNNTQYCLEKRR
jgi:hypothetical protein